MEQFENSVATSVYLKDIENKYLLDNQDVYLTTNNIKENEDMADMKKFLSTEGLSALVDQIKAEDAKVLAAAKSHAEGLGVNYDAAGTAATKVKELADGAVATNTAGVAENKAAIEKLNGSATTEGSVAKQISDAKALIDADIDVVEATANKNKEDIATINDGTNGILAQAKAYADTEDAKVEQEITNLAGLVGVIPEGYTSTTIAGYAKELADNVAANGYDDTALAARVSKNETDISALQTKDGELVAKDEELAAAIAAVKEDVDAFFADADMTANAKDTLKELQTYISSDETAASQMAASIKQNSDAIGELQTADATQDEKIAALEAKFAEGDGSVSDMIGDAKQEAIGAAAQDATTKANTAESNAKSYTDTEVGKDRARLDSLEAATHTHSNKALLDTYTQTEANLADAVAKKHEHSNATELAKIADGDVAKWNAAEGNAKTYADGLNTAMGTRVDGVASRVTELEEDAKTHALASDLTSAVERIAKNEGDIASLTSSLNSFTVITADEVNAMFA